MVQKGKTLAGISRYVRKSPKWYYFVLPVVSIFLIDYIILGNFPALSIISIMPFILLLIIDFGSIRFTNKKFNNNRIMYLDFVSLCLATLFFWIGILLKPIIYMPYY